MLGYQQQIVLQSYLAQLNAEQTQQWHQLGDEEKASLLELHAATMKAGT